ncbi:MAG TPA: VOC family protein [Acidimicrobiales bacterium]
MSWTRLRQVALVARDLEPVVADLSDAFGLEVAFRDPGVASFGLHNAVLPLGNQFVEVVSPVRPGTAAGRQLDRLGGDGGYMVICHTDDHARRRDRVAQLGVRVAWQGEDRGYSIMQLHPADTGGSFLEIDFQPGGDDPHGPWMPAGPDWQRAVRAEVVDRIAGVTVQSADAGKAAARWAEILETVVVDGIIALDNATITFVDGTVDSLVGVTVAGPKVTGDRVIAGVRFAAA